MEAITPDIPSLEKIQEMIAELSKDSEGEQLSTQMKQLKKALHQNPQACFALMPDDIGKMVDCLYKLESKMLVGVKEKKIVKKEASVNKAVAAAIKSGKIDQIPDDMF